MGWVEVLAEWIPAAVALPLVVVGLVVAQKFLERWLGTSRGYRFHVQLGMLALTVVGLLVVLVLLPLGEGRSDLLALLGILSTAAIALSSTTFLANVMAGLMLRSMRNYQVGDFLRCGEHFGRVSERGMVHTEIQTEDRDLTTIPNFYLVTHPMTVIHASGTIVSATVSLGYDVPHRRARECMLRAAAAAGLREPFVQVADLGDFSITYRTAGLLEEVKHVLSTRSRLRECMLDELHGAGIEIVSPTFMNTRSYRPGESFVPEPDDGPAPGEAAEASLAEDVAFEKAEAAESLERMEDAIETLTGEREALAKRFQESGEAGTEAAEAVLEQMDRRVERLRTVLEGRRDAMKK